MGKEQLCPSCKLKGKDEKMGVRQNEVDRDGKTTAEVFACNICHTHVTIEVKETKEEELKRLEARVAQLKQ